MRSGRSFQGLCQAQRSNRWLDRAGSSFTQDAGRSQRTLPMGLATQNSSSQRANKTQSNSAFIFPQPSHRRPPLTESLTMARNLQDRFPQNLTPQFDFRWAGASSSVTPEYMSGLACLPPVTCKVLLLPRFHPSLASHHVRSTPFSVLQNVQNIIENQFGRLNFSWLSRSTIRQTPNMLPTQTSPPSCEAGGALLDCSPQPLVLH